MDSCKQHEVSGVGEEHQEEWILGDGSSQSNIKPAEKVTIPEAFNNEVNVEIYAEQEVIDVDVGCGDEDERILGEPSSGKSNGKRAEKVTFTSVVRNPVHADAKPSRNSKNQTNHGISSKEDGGYVHEVSPRRWDLPRKLKIFSLDELKCATRNFKPDMCLGKGGFGEVFKGWVDEETYSPTKLDVGYAIAVKRLYRHKFTRLKEVKVIEHLLKILEEFRHPNFVKLLGYCSEDEMLLLVYEFMQNGSLSRHLSITGSEPLPWVTRVKIAVGVAEGLDFLYTTREFTADWFSNMSNIMLDMDFNAKLSDLDLEKLVNGSLTDDSKDPMYFRNKPDHIYYIGVVLLKILIQDSTSEWKEKVSLLRSSRNIRDLDPRLKQDHRLEGEFKLASLVLGCIDNNRYQYHVHHDRISIPKILKTLKGIYAVMEKQEMTTHQSS